jgi:hypothetical protein
MEQTVNIQIFQAVNKIESIAEKSESDSVRILSEVRSEFERLGNQQSGERRQMLEHIQSETESSNSRMDKVLRNVSDRMDELDGMYDDIQVNKN